MTENLDLLRSVSLFQELSDEELERIREIASHRRYNKKNIIFVEGDKKTAIYLIQDGIVKTYKTDENGHEHIVSLLQSGDLFPHTGFFHSSPYPATAETITDTRLIAIPVHEFEELVISTPAIAIKVMRAMSEKIWELQTKLQELTGHDAQHRGLFFLLKLAENYGETLNGSVHINIPMTHQEFASVIGTTRETVNRLLNRLRKEGLVEMKRNKLIIHDYDALKRRCHK
ncbi:Crp/Fnr family transcriptional regulator [Staphylospora marina]|uniref:Crp/Fnr family transcriptional regulator n=1 Tax=Staphylospora marina TaxID=2490858 RepID=UPI000F5C16E0|nr:Crp/Fnr family transcriptional regulator [Staphylospora marina]